MKLRIPRFNGLEEQAFFFAYIVYMVLSILTNTFYYRYFVGLYKWVIVFCVGILVLKELLSRKISTISFLGLIGLYMAAILVYLRTNGEVQKSFVCVFVFAIAARKIDFRKISKVSIFITGMMLLFVVASTLVGLIPNYHDSSSRNRNYLGFLYALYAPACW